MPQVDQVGDEIYRICAASPDFPITINQFLITGEHPALIHTGTYPMYEGVRKAVAEVIDELIQVGHPDQLEHRRVGPRHSSGAM